MSRETYNNLIVIINMIFLFIWTGLAIHTMHSHPDDIVEWVLFLVAAIGQATAMGLCLYKLFHDRLDN